MKLSEVAENLVESLGLKKREHVAIVGAGGKTSLLLELAEKLGSKKVIISTTTKIRYDEAKKAGKPLINLLEPEWKSRLKDCLKLGNQAILVSQVMDSGKVKGVAPFLADEIFQDLRIDYLLLEADGAAGRSVKAPSAEEPVIPSSVTKVVAMMGLDALNQTFNRENVFRSAEFRNITGIKNGERFLPERLCRLFIDPEGLFKNTPSSVNMITFLNRLDLLADKRRAFALADLIMDKSRRDIDRVVIGSIKDKEYYCRR